MEQSTYMVENSDRKGFVVKSIRLLRHITLLSRFAIDSRRKVFSARRTLTYDSTFQWVHNTSTVALTESTYPSPARTSGSSAAAVVRHTRPEDDSLRPPR